MNELLNNVFLTKEEDAVKEIRKGNSDSLYIRIASEDVEDYTGEEDNIINYINGVNELCSSAILDVILEIERKYPNNNIMENILKYIDNYFNTCFCDKEKCQ